MFTRGSAKITPKITTTNIIMEIRFINELIERQPFFSSPLETYPAKTGIKDDAIAPPISIEYIKSGI